jgi:hypothetical protein
MNGNPSYARFLQQNRPARRKYRGTKIPDTIRFQEYISNIPGVLSGKKIF